MEMVGTGKGSCFDKPGPHYKYVADMREDAQRRAAASDLTKDAREKAILKMVDDALSGKAKDRFRLDVRDAAVVLAVSSSLIASTELGKRNAALLHAADKSDFRCLARTALPCSPQHLNKPLTPYSPPDFRCAGQDPYVYRAGINFAATRESAWMRKEVSVAIAVAVAVAIAVAVAVAVALAVAVAVTVAVALAKTVAVAVAVDVAVAVALAVAIAVAVALAVAVAGAEIPL